MSKKQSPHICFARSPSNPIHPQCHDIKPSAKAQLIKESLKVGAHTAIDTLSTYWLNHAKMGMRWNIYDWKCNWHYEGGFSTPWSWSTGSNACGENRGSGTSGTAGTTTHITRLVGLSNPHHPMLDPSRLTQMSGFTTWLSSPSIGHSLSGISAESGICDMWKIVLQLNQIFVKCSSAERKIALHQRWLGSQHIRYKLRTDHRALLVFKWNVDKYFS